jgi:hypothetical protein
MHKNLLAFVIGATLSMSASATITFTKYEFSGPDITGWFVQRDDNQAIANYRIQVHGQYVSATFYPFPHESNIVAANNNHAGGNGPTGFTLFDVLNEVYTEALRVSFESGTLGYAAYYEQWVNPGYTGPNYDTHHAVVSSFAAVTKGTVDPMMALEMNSYGGYIDGIDRIVTTHRVPEPATLGLFAIGALGAAGVARRRKINR